MGREYAIGQTMPLDAGRGIVGDRLAAPRWYALTVKPQREGVTKAMLARHGIHSCYPEREKTWVIRGKRHRRLYPIISCVVYAKFKREPQWDVLKFRNIITGVYARNGIPIQIPGDIISGVMGLPTEAENLEAARREMLCVKVGDRAEIADGPLAGVMVDVTKVEGARVWFQTLTGIKGEGGASALIRSCKAQDDAV